MKYTCKHCCTIVHGFLECPVCHSKEHMVPIFINVSGGSHHLADFDFDLN